MSREHIPVLMYHAVHNQRSPISVSPQNFQEHMRWLKEQGIQVISAGSLIQKLAQDQAIPPNAVVLTFDDGFEHLYWNVYPVLGEYGFPATVFIVSGYCGKLNNWVGQPQGIPSLKLLNWEQMREMESYGIEFGAHSASHQRLDRLSADDLEIEVLQSKSDIEHHLGQDVNVFAYPYGIYNTQVKDVTASAFEGAYGTELGYVKLNSDPFSLERIDVYYFQRQDMFRRLFSPSGKFISALLRRYRNIRSWWKVRDGY